MSLQVRFVTLVLCLNVGVGTVLMTMYFLQHVQAIESKNIYQGTSGPLTPLIERETIPLGELLRFHALTLGASVLSVTGLIFIWFVRPLRKMETAIKSGDPTHLKTFEGAKDEFERLARAVGELFESRDAVQREVAERMRVEAVLRNREVQVASLYRTSELIHQNLHDRILQSLFALGLRLEVCLDSWPGAPSSIRKSLAECAEQLNEAIRQIRKVLSDNSADAPTGLVQEDLADWMEKLNTMGRGQFDLDVEPQALDMLNIIEVSEMKSILNEAVSNALRHSGAGRARISIKREGNTVHARVWDDGRGFDPSQTALGNGLRNIEKRARKMGASYSIESAPGKGCVVSVTIGPGSAR